MAEQAQFSIVIVIHREPKRIVVAVGGWVGHHIQIMNRFILDQKNVFSMDSQWNYTKKKKKKKNFRHTGRR